MAQTTSQLMHNLGLFQRSPLVKRHNLSDFLVVNTKSSIRTIRGTSYKF